MAVIPIVTNIFFEIISPLVPMINNKYTNWETIDLIFKKH